MKIVAVIPARLQSTRFPRKMLFSINGLAMIEHVRRRALMCSSIVDVYVATCDEEISRYVKKYNGNVIMTSKSHINGTLRVAEAIADIDCSHVVLLQGDEPLLLPRHVELLANAIRAAPEVGAWNLVGALENESELDRQSYVKCSVATPHEILYCYRRSPHLSNFQTQKAFVRKMLGIIGYRKEFLLKLVQLPASPTELAEAIEQMRILENGLKLSYVEVAPALPSINEPEDLQDVLELLSVDDEQKLLVQAISTGE